MTDTIQETITTQSEVKPVFKTINQDKATNYQTVEYFIYFILGTLEILLASRLLLKLTGASSSSGFVGLIYGLTGIFILPFEGVFRRLFSYGSETTSIFEPSTIVAMIVYAVLFWGLIKLLRIISREKQALD